MTLLALSCTLVFVLASMVISIWQKLGLEKEIAIGTVRAAVQLLAVGYVLKFIFTAENPLFLVLLITLMIVVASLNASKRGQGMKGIFWRIAVAISAMELLMMGILLGLDMIEPTPQYIIPISGMTVGSSMIVSGLFMNQLKREFQASRGEIETLLSLGASAKQAIQDVRRRTVKFSMIPTIDGMKTVGLVQLPGMMTGMIVAGADPVEAVRYQILIVFSFTGAAAMTSMLLSVLCYKLLFTKELRMKQIGSEK